MKKKTFGFTEPLKSSEFGNLLYNLVKPGVYRAPSITYNSVTRQLSVSGNGSYVLNDYDGKIYTIKIDYEGESPILGIVPTVSKTYAYAVYKYNESSDEDIEIEFNERYDFTKGIRLCRIENDAIDLSCMQLVNQPFSSIVDFFEYNAGVSNTVKIRLNQKFIINSGINTSTEMYTFNNVSLSQSAFIYAADDGSLKIKIGTNLPKRLGKLIIAEKQVNSSSFTINDLPIRSEITTKTIEAITESKDPYVTQFYNSVKEEDQTILNKLLDKIISELSIVNSRIKLKNIEINGNQLIFTIESGNETVQRIFYDNNTTYRNLDPNNPSRDLPGTLSLCSVEEKKVWNAKLDKTTLNQIYPPGTIYLSINNYSPANFLPGSIWEPLNMGNTRCTFWILPQNSGTSNVMVQPGLPNITGTFRTFGYYFDSPFGNLSGAFSTTGERYAYDYEGDSWKTVTTFQFNASKSNAIYGASSEVQPRGITIYAWKRVS